MKGASEKIKRPLNAFIIWSKKRRRVIANENPQMHNFDISRKLGLEWQKLSEEEKAYYFEEAKRLKEEHKERYPNYKYQPRKRDKSNKRGKMFQAAPFHFNFFTPGTPYYEGGYPYAVSEPRLRSFSPKSSHLSTELTLEAISSPSSSPSASSPLKLTQENTTKANVICPSFRPPSESFVAYRSCDSSYMHLRPGLEWSHWYPGTSSRIGTVPYYSCLYPWHSRPAEYRS
ncbi:hypothetical protein QZH41_003216 [Actinostola sp. cb2023]|nr:hypothetical protein QZH41_003216 [Actinostola sp. cb2023]